MLRQKANKTVQHQMSPAIEITNEAELLS